LNGDGQIVVVFIASWSEQLGDLDYQTVWCVPFACDKANFAGCPCVIAHCCKVTFADPSLTEANQRSVPVRVSGGSIF
jgi:hypothetical protein